MKRSIVFVFVLLCAPSVFAGGKVVLPNSVIEERRWTQEELAREVAVKKLYEDDSVSVLLMRLAAPERPHFHDTHTLTVTILSGEMTVNFDDHKVTLSPGDVVSIPKGAYHWAEPEGKKPVEALVAFTPKFDGKDRRWAD